MPAPHSPTGEPPKKIDELRAYMRAGNWRAALSLAAKFPRLGDHKVRIQRAWEAYARPDFQRQLGRDPAALIADGIAALHERYDASKPAPDRGNP